MTDRILLVDEDPALRRFLAAELRAEGYDVDVLSDPAAVLPTAAEGRPDLLLIDLDAHDARLDALRKVRSNPWTAALPVILLAPTADATEQVLGLAAGADDYVVKPFDTLELLARIGGTLRRTADSRALSPLTGLPGNHRIELEIAGRATARRPYAVCHVDLDEFKSFNDSYGFQRGDDLLLLLAGCLQRAVDLVPGQSAFLGHVGGDDFIVVCTPEQAEPLCRAALAEFDEAVPQHYDAADAARGYLEVIDRRGVLCRQPLVSVSVGIGMHQEGQRDFRAVVAAANEMKYVAKSRPGSQLAIDRRS